MIRFRNISHHYWRNMISRTALVIVAVVLIVLFLPRTRGKLKVNFSIMTKENHGCTDS